MKTERRELTKDELERYRWLVEIIDSEEPGDWIDELDDDQWWEASGWIGQVIVKVHRQGLRQGYERGVEKGRSHGLKVVK
jgi:hypothetical protein